MISKRHLSIITAAAIQRIVVAGCLLLLAGCSEKGVPLYPVSGTVTYQGKPAANAQVVFHDKRPAEQIHDIPIPRGRTDSEGKFRLSCHVPGDGAPAGEYAVVVQLSNISAADLAEPDQESGDPESAGSAPVAEGVKYLDPATSGLKAVVREEENVLPPFELE